MPIEDELEFAKRIIRSLSFVCDMLYCCHSAVKMDTDKDRERQAEILGMARQIVGIIGVPEDPQRSADAEHDVWLERARQHVVDGDDYELGVFGL